MLKMRLAFAVIVVACSASLFSQGTASVPTLYDVGDVISIPIYPRVAAASGQSGDLHVSFIVNARGRCKLLKIKGESRFLIDGVRKAVAGWTFLPRKTTYAMDVDFSFQLLPATASESEVMSELFPLFNKIVIKSRRPNLEKGLIIDPPLLPNK